MIGEIQNPLFLRQELTRAKRDMFVASNVREMKMLAHRVTFLSQQLKSVNGKKKK